MTPAPCTMRPRWATSTTAEASRLIADSDEGPAAAHSRLSRGPVVMRRHQAPREVDVAPRPDGNRHCHGLSMDVAPAPFRGPVSGVGRPRQGRSQSSRGFAAGLRPALDSAGLLGPGPEAAIRGTGEVRSGSSAGPTVCRACSNDREFASASASGLARTIDVKP
jgi:hypothetical protein